MAAVLVSAGLQDLVPMARSEGKHVSAAIRKLCVRFGHFEDSPFPDDKTRMELGSSFEDALIVALVERIRLSNPTRYIRLGEQQLDGVYGTPDLYDTELGCIIEVKLTWLSTKWEPDSEKFWKYWVQVKSYCNMVGCLKGQVWICHINGNYQFREGTKCPWCGKEGSGPHMHVWQDEFNESELHDNWMMVKAYA